ncbi:unnamed protein product [Callosobruchus maculatus]|uniref:Uncharacterized protein n=1 Tax=Callosobruchus maculatus TaxID=64391 RepID=A0A653D7D9_CALMS|nr:unnamed protein product [Callosobruchus maculatus]
MTDKFSSKFPSVSLSISSSSPAITEITRLEKRAQTDRQTDRRK